MSLFPETIQHALGGKKVQMAFLVLLDFTTQPMRLWKGNGVLDTNDGQKWQAIGQMGSMTGIGQAVNGAAPEMSFTLSAVDAGIVHLARDEFASEARGRLVYVLIQFFGVDDPTDPDNQRALDNPYPVCCGRMLQPSFSLDNGGAWSVTIKAESLFSLRSRPKASMYTDSDQRQRFPGLDKGFEFVGALVNKVVTWPDY